MARFALTLALTFVTLAARGGEIMLRSAVELKGSIVRLGDVAEIVSSDPAEVAELSSIPLLPAPAPGTQAFLNSTQLRDLLAANAVDVGLLTIHGATAVAISTPATVPAKPEPRPAVVPQKDRDAVADQVGAAIVEYLKNQSGHELWEVTVNVDPKLLELCGKTGPQLAVSGAQAPWTGRQRFDIASIDGALAVRAYATVVRVEMVVVALRPIAAGDFIRATDVALRPHIGQMSNQVAVSLEQVVGKEARQAIRADAMLYTNQVRSPLLVRKGERVAVRARAGSIVVRTYGVVQEDGGLGELVQVQALEGRERYAARVSGLRELEVFAAGASADEVAAARK